MARSSSMTYDPTTGTWKSSSGGSSSSSSSKKSTSSSSNSGTNNPNGSSGGKLTSSNSDKNSSKGNAEKKYNTIEYNILTGTLNFIATEETIKLKAGDTVELLGIGKYLSGLYYVQDITRTIGKDGYSHSATVIKTDFGKSVKKTKKKLKSKLKKKKKRASKKDSKETQKKIYRLKAGESLWTVAKKFYGSGSKYTKIAKANDISPSQYKKLPVGYKLIIP